MSWAHAISYLPKSIHTNLVDRVHQIRHDHISRRIGVQREARYRLYNNRVDVSPKSKRYQKWVPMRLNLHFPQLVLCSFEDKTGIGKKEAIELNWNNGFVLTAFIEYSTRRGGESLT